MPSRLPRRRVLRSLASAALLGLGGCTSGDPSRSPTTSSRPPTSTATPPPTSESTPPPTTYGPTSGPVETVSATPPGSPALDPSGSWRSFRADSRNSGHVPDGTGLRDGEGYWRLDAGGAASVADGTLYNLSVRGEEKTLTRRDPTTAAVRSATPLVRHGTNAPPTVADGRVFVTSFVAPFCLDAATGELLWRGPDMDGIQGVPTVSDGTVFVNSGGFEYVDAHLRAFDTATGTEQWRYDTASESKSTPAVADGRVFVVATDGLHAVDADTGKRVFLASDAGARWATPAVADGRVYVVADTADEDTDALVAVDATTGEVRWRQSTPGRVDGPPVVTGDEVVARTSAGVVVLDRTGEQRRALGALGDPVGVVGDVLYTAGDGRVAAHDVTSGERLWAYTTESVRIHDTVGRRVYGVAPVDGAVYVAARDAFHAVGPADP